MNTIQPQKSNILLGVLIAVLFAGAGVFAGFYLYGKINPQTPSTEQSSTNSIVQTPQEKAEKSVSEVVQWNASPVELKEDFKLALTGSINESEATWKTKYYSLGKFIDGQYKGRELILLQSWCEDTLGCTTDSFRFVKSGNNFTLLRKHSDDLSPNNGLVKFAFGEDYTYEIPSLIFPEIIQGPKPGQVLQLRESKASNKFFDTSKLKKVFTDPAVGDVYTTKDGIIDINMSDPFGFGNIFGNDGFYVKAPDSTTRIYNLKNDFLEADVPAVTWNDGSQNTNEYAHQDIGGCGSSDDIAVANRHVKYKNDIPSLVAPIDINKDLKPVGKNSKGEMIYELTDKNAIQFKDIYDTIFVPEGQKKIAYDDFIKRHPLFFWADPFDRLIEFKNSEFLPMAECGKPVIYLYPEHETNVSVKVEPKGGMSYSDPEYRSGWMVKASPNGDLVELDSGAFYPYLFWEGRGGIYEKPDRGFVVAKKDVYKFLVEKLGKLGLNKKETSDFIEFWYPRMQSAPYYFVTFLGNRAMDELAPLTIDPKPDTVIRILMDFSPLKNPVDVKEFKIITPERKGFTVVEWGGVLR